MDKATLNELRKRIKDYTLSMDNDEYVDFMRDLAEWANNEADLAEYQVDFDTDDFE